MKIIVNGKTHEIDANIDRIESCYESIANLAGYAAGGLYDNPTIVYSGVNYGDGSLFPGHRLVLEDGMIFNVGLTGNA